MSGDITVANRLFVTNDASFNGKLFINSDLSMNGNLTLGKNMNINGNLSVKQYSTKLTVYTVDYQLMVAQDLSVNGRLFMTGDVSINGNLTVPTKYISVGRAEDGSMPTTGVLRVGGYYGTGTYLQIQKSGTVSWSSPTWYDNTRYINCTGNAENTKDFNVGPGGVGIGYAPPLYTRGGVDGLYVNGRVGVGTITPGAMLEVSGGINVQGVNVINFGSNTAGKEGNAGKIGYGAFSGGACLDIVGAGTTTGSRKVYIYDQLGIATPPSYPLDVTGTIRGQNDFGLQANSAAWV